MDKNDLDSYISLAEAEKITGLSNDGVRKAIFTKKIHAIKKPGYRVWFVDLDSAKNFKRTGAGRPFKK